MSIIYPIIYLNYTNYEIRLYLNIFNLRGRENKIKGSIFIQDLTISKFLAIPQIQSKRGYLNFSQAFHYPIRITNALELDLSTLLSSFPSFSSLWAPIITTLYPREKLGYTRISLVHRGSNCTTPTYSRILALFSHQPIYTSTHSSRLFNPSESLEATTLDSVTGRLFRADFTCKSAERTREHHGKEGENRRSRRGLP